MQKIQIDLEKEEAFATRSDGKEEPRTATSRSDPAKLRDGCGPRWPYRSSSTKETDEMTWLSAYHFFPPIRVSSRETAQRDRYRARRARAFI